MASDEVDTAPGGGNDSTTGAPVVVVTGASAGVGRASAIAFARRGYRVALIARGRAGLDGARGEVESAGSEASIIEADTADADRIFAAADQVVDRWGRIDVWVNNAMATVVGPVDATLPAEFRRVTEVTYLGAIHGTLAALRHMRPRDRGTIVQVGSALAYRSIPLQSAYCGAKAAIRGFTDSLRSELLHDRSRVRITMVQLPGVNTPQFDWSHMHEPFHHRPVGGCWQPEVIAQRIVDAAERAPRELWIGSSTIQSILGNFVAPGLLDRYLARKAYDQQLSSRPVLPGDPDILYQPANVDHGARGRFSAQAKTRSIDVDPAYLRGGLALSLLAALGAAFLWRRQ